jgi:glycosidase
MLDLVINHVAAQSGWLREFLAPHPKLAEYFITVEEGIDLSEVIRPRALPVLTHVQTVQGERLVWATFSTDQIDLKYANPDVFPDWKELGTPCIHRPETQGVN